MPDSPPRLLRRPEVCSRTGLSDTRIDELESQGLFPRRVSISTRAIGWVSTEIDEYIRQRIARRDAQTAKAAPQAAAQP